MQNAGVEHSRGHRHYGCLTGVIAFLSAFGSIG
jgi:hypothetical protein